MKPPTRPSLFVATVSTTRLTFQKPARDRPRRKSHAGETSECADGVPHREARIADTRIAIIVSVFPVPVGITIVAGELETAQCA